MTKTKLKKPIATGEPATEFRLLEFTIKLFAAPTEDNPDARTTVLGVTVELFGAAGGKIQRKTLVFYGDDPVWETFGYAELESKILAVVKSQLEAE